MGVEVLEEQALGALRQFLRPGACDKSQFQFRGLRVVAVLCMLLPSKLSFAELVRFLQLRLYFCSHSPAVVQPHSSMSLGHFLAVILPSVSLGN